MAIWSCSEQGVWTGVRGVLKFAATVHARLLGKVPASGVSILMYHRVVGDLPLELDLSSDLFRQQMEWLARSGKVVTYDAALDALLEGRTGAGLKYVVTFDDAYEDFYTVAWPVLRELGLPAVLYVPTRFMDEPTRLPLSRVVEGAAERMRSMTWAQLREVAADPLITIGAHTHSHPDLVRLTDDEIAGEMRAAAGRFQTELGFVPQHFAYPRGIWDPRVRNAVAPYCASAVTTGGEVATPKNAERYALTRVPIRRSDGWRWFNDRVSGRLIGEERLVGFAKRLLGRPVPHQGY